MKDLRSVLNKKRLVVLNAENREQLTAHFDVSFIHQHTHTHTHTAHMHTQTLTD